ELLPLVETARRQRLPIRQEGQALHAAPVPQEQRQLAASGHVPAFDLAHLLRRRVAPRARGQQPAVGTEGQATHRPGVPPQCGPFPAGRCIPEPQRMVPAAGGQRLSVPRERQALDCQCIDTVCQRREVPVPWVERKGSKSWLAVTDFAQAEKTGAFSSPATKSWRRTPSGTTSRLRSRGGRLIDLGGLGLGLRFGELADGEVVTPAL